jgi:hypothetical protein
MREVLSTHWFCKHESRAQAFVSNYTFIACLEGSVLGEDGLVAVLELLLGERFLLGGLGVGCTGDSQGREGGEDAHQDMVARAVLVEDIGGLVGTWMGGAVDASAAAAWVTTAER